MIWLAWRQFRIQALVALGALALAAVVLAVTGAHLHDLYDMSGIATCKAHGDCAVLEAAFYQPASNYWPFQAYETAIFLALALILTGFCFWWVRHRMA